ncbi:MAG: alpha/beta hydrolase [Clostridiales bacterium]|nr:alpha/beta hydrolase [Clostridiales bacterium]
MITQEIRLDLKGQAPDVVIHPYILDNSQEIQPDRIRPLVILLPGGGYEMRSFREAEPVALRLMSLGLSVCLVDYAVTPDIFPAALLQIMETIAYAREHSKQWHIDPDRIIVMGFSAGGHLAASVGVFWNKPFYSGKIGHSPEEVKPNALCLCYPVITSGEYAHRGSIELLLGEEIDIYSQTVSLEEQVNKDVPPCFIWHTWYDQSVPVENALLFAQALRKYHIPFSLHIFSKGVHGLSLSNDQVFGDSDSLNAREDTARWVELFDDWRRQL